MDQKQSEQTQGFEVFVKNVSFKANENDVGDFFSTFGKVENVRILKDKTGRSKGGAFVKFATEEGMNKALEAQNAVICEREVTVEKSVRKERTERPYGERMPQQDNRRGGNNGDRRPQGERQERVERPPVEISETTLTVFVGNLSFATDEQSLQTFFKSCGKVLSANVKKYQDGKSKGFGFVDFSCMADVEAAVLLNQSELDGRQVRVNVAAPKPEENPRGEQQRGERQERRRDDRRDDRREQRREEKPRVQRNAEETKSQGFEVYVKNLSFKAHENDIGDYFSAACGEVDSVLILKDQNGRSKGGAFVTFMTEQGMNKALDAKNVEICGREVTVEKSKGKQERTYGDRPRRDNREGERRGNQEDRRPNQDTRRGNNDRRPQQDRQQGERPKRVEVEITETTLTVFVGNLSFKTNDDSLTNFFSSCGQVVSAKVKYDQDGNSKGFGHVDFTCKEDVVKAVAKNQSSLDGREIRVNVAAPRTENGPRGGGRGGGQGGQRRN